MILWSFRGLLMNTGGLTEGWKRLNTASMGLVFLIMGLEDMHRTTAGVY